MSQAGNNLPAFRALQLDFAAHLRAPDVHPLPAGVDARRMRIYVELVFNNIKQFLDSTFPVSRKIVGEAGWQALAREFVHRHDSASPYFLQVCEEFLRFLENRGLVDLPPFLLELCHYEWVELAVDVAVDDVSCDAGPLIEPVHTLVYRYPVHEIGPAHQPLEPPPEPTHLLVYRNADCQVRFMRSNPLTHRLVDLLRSLQPEAALKQLAQELEGERPQDGPAGSLPNVQSPLQQRVQREGAQIIARFIENGILDPSRMKPVAEGHAYAIDDVAATDAVTPPKP